jgi:2-methylcitrate dehydratase PrpD
MMRKVQRILDPGIEAMGWEKIRSTVEVDLADGRTLVQQADERYRGGPDLPFTRSELVEKFSDCASLLLDKSEIETAFSMVESVEQLPNIGDLVSSLSHTTRAFGNSA